jgi:hypothetical protein
MRTRTLLLGGFLGALGTLLGWLTISTSAQEKTPEPRHASFSSTELGNLRGPLRPLDSPCHSSHDSLTEPGVCGTPSRPPARVAQPPPCPWAEPSEKATASWSTVFAWVLTTGTSAFNGPAFGVPNFTTLTVFQILSATNNAAVAGEPWGMNISLRDEGLSVFMGINGG